MLQRQRILFSAFRADQYADPEGYMASLGLVLSQYPDDVVVFVTDPRTGVQRAFKWPPTIAEIVAACDARMSDLARQDRFKNWGKRNEPALLEGPHEKRPTLEELHAKYGVDWGLSPGGEPKPNKPAFNAPSWEEITASYSSDPSRIERLTKET